MGSSPRLRGTQGVVEQVCHAEGIIPALAGNTRLAARPVGVRSRRPSCLRDHPRACGEHPLHDRLIGLREGSSPRLRGTRVDQAAVRRRSGIIPALAGNTSWAPQPDCTRWDHPRACGEHWQVAVWRGCGVGSSPRLRGTPVGHFRGDRRIGIIPALAGNTPATPTTTPTRRDHPRACGEHKSVALYVRQYVGSSPRLRGTPAELERLDDVLGIIPALAGNTGWVC